ncbi:sigma-70 family RNA polymerase sigma factor [Dyadobacter tibetensis]|uniref:sigma-70 family RNA polymerase sigma factor n=1 Tax=Dyadobacter tibetensis TaxID=1211851 RepID=UPI000471B2B9|nr:sigma-70 family RNA polymerase sigma factor [Dyadobacter tibetensis]
MHSRTVTDEQLLAGLRANQEEALSGLMDRYYVALCNFGNIYLQEMSLTEELVADLFYTIWCKRAELEIHTSLKSYLYVSVKNKALQCKRRADSLPYICLEEAEEQSNEMPNALEQIILKELNQDIIDLVHTLPEKRRVIFELNRFESFTYKEISELLQISEKTVLNQMSLAIKYLRNYSNSFQNRFS